MVSIVKKFLWKYFKSEPKNNIAHGVPPDAPDPGPRKAGLDKPVLRGDPSTKPIDEDDPPPLYSPPLDSNHHNASRLMAYSDPRHSAVPRVPREPSVSTHQRWQASVAATDASSDDSTISSDTEELDDSESDADYTKGKYRHPNENKRPPQTFNFQHASPPRNGRARSSNHAASGQRNASDSAFNPDDSFDAAFGHGGTFDSLFGRGGTFETRFGTGGTFRPVTRDGNGTQSTHFAYRDANTHYFSASLHGESSHANAHIQSDIGYADHWTGYHDRQSQNSDVPDFLREGGSSNGGPGFLRNQDYKNLQHRSVANNRRQQPQQPANHNDLSGHCSLPISLFNNSRNVTVGSVHINHIKNVYTVGSSGSGTSVQTRRHYVYRND